MRILKVFSALLSYPRPELIDALDEIEAIIVSENPADHSGLLNLIGSMRERDLIDLQEAYVNLFDRGHSLSLHLFEHVHGQSKDRGQAMVDLMALYQANGFEIAVKELPDYIPLFLEFLSEQPPESALSILSDASPVMNLLAARLSKRQSAYCAIFDSLNSLTGISDEPLEVDETDESLERMDEIWEEEAVSFMANPCQADRPVEMPVKLDSCMQARAGRGEGIVRQP